MDKVCDHKSVGVFVWRGDDLLLIQRAKLPYGYALPAGHVDGDTSFEAAAIRELREEVGIKARALDLVAEGRKDNPCRRKDGTWHEWKLYRATDFAGVIAGSVEETKRVGFFTKEQIRALADRTEKYLRKEIPENEWMQSPGLEPVMLEWFKRLQII
jgi:ADP-ribose pyrophosphatase YjhB (NUDIX family)